VLWKEPAGKLLDGWTDGSSSSADEGKIGTKKIQQLLSDTFLLLLFLIILILTLAFFLLMFVCKSLVEKMMETRPDARRPSECSGSDSVDVVQETLDIVGSGRGGVQELVLLDGFVIDPVGGGIRGESYAASIREEFPETDAVAAV
jgi:hypothetical protein